MKFGLFLMPEPFPWSKWTLSYDLKLEEIAYAERFGYDEVWVGEHHTGAYENIPAPDIFIAKASALTSRTALGKETGGRLAKALGAAGYDRDLSGHGQFLVGFCGHALLPYLITSYPERLRQMFKPEFRIFKGRRLHGILLGLDDRPAGITDVGQQSRKGIIIDHAVTRHGEYPLENGIEKG